MSVEPAEIERTAQPEDTAGAAVPAVTTLAAAATTYPIAPGTSVNVRSGPGTGYPVVKVLPAGSRVSINCQSPGTWITGPYGTTNIWDNIASGQYISDAYVQTGSDGYIRPRCS
ncbi:SH3 domain-containing protein [Streptomyces sp. NPDC017943]|uniref:SH3 domain-containing protein n=1 Tax=Streptomyces sp. NPDC017943 TaxID=3365019 RepID=UPI00378D83D1